MRSMVEGARGVAAGRDAEALTPTLSRKREREFAGQGKGAKDCQPSARIVCWKFVARIERS
jgi:hypothetical protein